MDNRYKLAAGTQVRREDFGLLFYQMNGPRLHFMASGNLLTEDFFHGTIPLEVWLNTRQGREERNVQAAKAVAAALKQLVLKGVLVEC